MSKFIKVKRLMTEIYKEKGKITTERLYILTVCIFIILLSGITIFQSIDIYNLRTEQEYNCIVQYDHMLEVADENTPLGIKNQYRWTFEGMEIGEKALAFYVVHQLVEVYFDEELVYSLNLKEDDKIGKTPGSNWVMIPLYSSDEGTEVCINIIPVYEQIRNKEPVFFIDSKVNIYRKQLKADLWQIILSLIAIFIGMMFIIISIIKRNKMKKNYDLLYLGIFSFAIGVWRFTDIPFAAMMFSQNTMAVSYISLSMILLSVVPLALIIKRQFLNKYSKVIEMMSILYCILILFIVGAQIMNIADLRETIHIAFIITFADAVLVGLMVFHKARNNKVNRKARRMYIYLSLCIIGAIIDLSVFYVKGDSSGLLCTLIAFLVYIINMGYMFIKDTNYKANIDIHTGLYNKSRCNEMLDENEYIKDSLGIIMFDLNNLKYTNDTFGHENGDILISEFAYVLKENISNGNFVGRYGGDEFIVVINECDKNKLKEAEEKISESVARYNLKNNKIPISYSMGSSLSSDYPGLTLRELLEKADDYMYKNKKLYHDRNLCGFS